MGTVDLVDFVEDVDLQRIPEVTGGLW